MNNFIFKALTKDEYENIKDIPANFTSFAIFNSKIRGIYLNNTLIGLYSLGITFNEYLSLDIFIFPSFRGRHLTGYTIENIILYEGENNPSIEKFMAMVSPLNKRSNIVFQKLKWQVDSSYDEAMLNEGGEFFNIYYKENPYYENSLKKNLRMDN